MSKLIDQLILTLSFFSRLPLPQVLSNRISHDDKLGHAAALFPIAGMIIAIIPALIWYLASLYLPPTLAAGLAIIAGLLITGGLHEDGLADCADGLGGTSQRDKALEIMRDSRIGTYGALALISTVGLRWLALASLSATNGVMAIFIAYSGSRAAITIAMQFSSYAREDGLGAQAQDIAKNGFLIALAIAIIIAMLLGAHAGLISLVLGLALAWGFLKYLEYRIGGYSGDGLGAMQQLCEITIFILLAGFWT